MWIKTPGITFIKIQLCLQHLSGRSRLFVFRFEAENFWYKHPHLLDLASSVQIRNSVAYPREADVTQAMCGDRISARQLPRLGRADRRGRAHPRQHAAH